MRRTVWITLLLALLPVACGGYPKYVPFSTVDSDPDWSPDGRIIAFTSSRDDGSTGIYVIRPDGHGLRRLFNGTAKEVDWSPDGDRIAFVGADGIYVMRRDGGSPVRILRGGQFSLPAWAPDGHRLAVVNDDQDLKTAIYVVRLDGSGLRRLLSPSRAGSTIATSETEPAWSPNGRQIAFQCGPAAVLCAANADGTGDIRRLASAGGNPSWSPDARRVVFDVYHSRGHFRTQARSLSVVDVDGGGVQKVTYGPAPPG